MIKIQNPDMIFITGNQCISLPIVINKTEITVTANKLDVAGYYAATALCECYTPVSYTHLDVYKRQIQGIGLLLI